MTDDDFLKEVAEDTDIVLPAEDKMGRLTALAQKQLNIEQNLEDLELQMKTVKQALKEVSEQEIPELMTEIGMREFTLSNGRKVKVSPFYTGKITDDAAYDWLEENGYGDIVKVSIAIDTRLSDDERTTKVRKLLHDAGIDWNEKQGVHYQTLCAWIKEVISSGKPIDRELFNVYTGQRASIK